MNQPTTLEQVELIRFPSIGQFRNVIKAVQHQATYLGKDDAGKPLYATGVNLPKLQFRGTVKLHGTNAAVVFRPTGVSFQSRERVLGPGDDDNMGFYSFMNEQGPALLNMKYEIARKLDIDITTATITVYGEWCGGSIQKSVALNQLEKMFVFFLVNVNGLWFEADGLLSRPAARIYNILDFPTWYREIDFNQPELRQNELAELTLKVEQCCPVAAEFGVKGTGEGIVWRCVTRPQPEFWFKVKGKEHSASQVKTLASVDIEAVQAAMEFVNKTVTEARLQQGLQHLVNELRKPMDQTSTGDFIRWIVGDIHKEEADTLAASGLTPKEVNARISAAARDWFFQQLAKNP